MIARNLRLRDSLHRLDAAEGRVRAHLDALQVRYARVHAALLARNAVLQRRRAFALGRTLLRDVTDAAPGPLLARALAEIRAQPGHSARDRIRLSPPSIDLVIGGEPGLDKPAADGLFYRQLSRRVAFMLGEHVLRRVATGDGALHDALLARLGEVLTSPSDRRLFGLPNLG